MCTGGLEKGDNAGGAMITGEELESSFFMYQMNDTYDSDSEEETH